MQSGRGPGWRSLELVSVPAAWGLGEGAPRSGKLTSEPTEREAACKGSRGRAAGIEEG